MPDSTFINAMISLKDYYERIHFGFASSTLSLTPELQKECLDNPVYTAAEITFEQLQEMTDAEKKILRNRYFHIQCGSLLSPQLVQLVLHAGTNIRHEFVRTCEEILAVLQKNDIQTGILDFNLASVLQNQDDTELLKKILQMLYPDLQKTGRTLLLPVHIPFENPDIRGKVSSFLRDMMIPNLKLQLMIYPHELKPDFIPFDLTGNLRLETRSVYFCCNADCGNRLVREHIIPWLKYFALTSFTAPYFFCPFSHENRMASVVSKEYADLAQKILKSAEDTHTVS